MINTTGNTSLFCVNDSCGTTTISEPYKEPHILRFIRLILFAAVTMASILGNLIVIKAVLGMHRKPFTYCLVTNLAVAELVSTICVPFAISYQELKTWMFGGFLCRFIIPLQVLSMAVVTITIAVISIRRYQVVSGTCLHFPRTRIGMWVTILGLWIFGLGLSFPLFIIYTVIQFQGGPNETIKFCVENFSADPWPAVEVLNRYNIIRIFLSFVIPVLVMVVFYGAVAVNFKQHIKRLRNTRARVDSAIPSTSKSTPELDLDVKGRSPQSHQRQMIPLQDIINSVDDAEAQASQDEHNYLIEQERDLIKMFYFIILVFVIFYLPYQTYFLLEQYHLLAKWKYNYFARNYLFLLTCFPSALHPLCYGTKNKFYARAFKKLFLCKH